jgi:Fic family protein
LLRAAGELPSDVVQRLRQYFRLRNIYHSNAIEGNRLTIGETRVVIEDGLTLAGMSMKDQAEARNLGLALDYLEELAKDRETPISEADVKQLHSIVLKDIDVENAGRYRAIPVTIGGSNHKPPSPDNVPSEMGKLSRWLASASLPREGESGLVHALTAHAWFVNIHPFADGNGRTARLLMDLMLLRHGNPILVVTKDDRKRYYAALAESDVAGDLSALTSLGMDALGDTLDVYEDAMAQHRQEHEWAAAIADTFSKDERIRAHNEYELWRTSVLLLRTQFHQVAQLVNQYSDFGKIQVRDFDLLDFEKYSSLRRGVSARGTWFFRMDFRSGRRESQYLFFFGFPSSGMRRRVEVTVHVARGQAPHSYVTMDRLNSPAIPTLAEVGYVPESEEWLERQRGSEATPQGLDVIARQFVEGVIRVEFGTTGR